MKASKETREMAAYQKGGVILVTFILATLQKIKYQNYRLFTLYDEARRSKELDFNTTDESNSTGTIFEDENITKFLFQCLLANNCLAILSCVYLTSWSDRHGRKILLILPFIGSIMSDIFMLVLLFAPSVSSGVLLFAEGVDGFLGGTMLMSLGCLCYITDSTDHRQRTFFFSVFFGMLNALPVLDLSLQYYWTPYQTSQDFRVLVLGAVLYRVVLSIFFLIYIKVCVSESVFLLGSFQGNPWANLLTPINVSDTINCVFKRRLDNMRFYIVVLTNIFLLYNICRNGNIIVFPHYFNHAFSWSSTTILIFSGIFTASQTLALWFVTYLASVWRMLDSDLGMYGCVTLGVSSLVLTFCKQGYVAAVGALIGIGSLVVPVTVLSILSKLVERIEIGSMFAGIGFLALITQLIASISYTALEELCREAEVPQTIFLLSFGLISFCLLFFIFLKRNISPHLLGHLNGSESLALINKKGKVHQVSG